MGKIFINPASGIGFQTPAPNWKVKQTQKTRIAAVFEASVTSSFDLMMRLQIKKQASHEVRIMATSGIPVGKEIEVSPTLPGIFLPTAHTRPVESIHVNGTVNEINRATDEAIREFLKLAIIFLVMLINRSKVEGKRLPNGARSCSLRKTIEPLFGGSLD